MSFAGFPEEGSGPGSQGALPRKVVGGEGGRKTKDRLLLAAEKKANNLVGGDVEKLPEGARLSAPPSTPVKLKISEDGRCTVLSGNNTPLLQEKDTVQEKGDRLKEEEEEEKDGGGNTEESKPPTEEKKTDSGTTEPSETDSSSVSKLERFQEKQKRIEEQNRRRKEILTQAISDRQKKTVQETRKLQIIQAELAKIDTLLNTDVQYLRDSIEQASFEFMKAQKRYDDAEKELIESKLHLFGVMERKELLTDHLCAIIEQNEARKATRLSELMEELQIDNIGIESSPQVDNLSLQDLRQPMDLNTIHRTLSKPGVESTDKEI